MTLERLPATRWLLAALAVAQVALLGWAASARSLLLVALVEGLLLALLALVLLIDRYGRARRHYEADLARAAAARERTRLAEDLHDLVGHELSLVALRAAALQVHSEGPVAARAGELRGQVEQAVLQLRQVVQLLGDGEDGPGVALPAARDLVEVVDRVNASGGSVTLTGEGALDGLSAPVRATALRVAQEGLTNAARHAPGALVGVDLRVERDVLRVVVTNAAAGPIGDSGTGLAALARRVAVLGGDLRRDLRGGRHVLHVVLPLAPRLTPNPSMPAVTGPRPGRTAVRWAAAPAAVGLAALLSFYGWSGHSAELEQTVFNRLAVGQPADPVRLLLPSRQSPLRMTQTAAPPLASRCRYYTDGNFPLALATYEICFDGSRVTRLRDLRREPLL